MHVNVLSPREALFEKKKCLFSFRRRQKTGIKNKAEVEAASGCSSQVSPAGVNPFPEELHITPETHFSTMYSHA